MTGPEKPDRPPDDANAVRKAMSGGGRQPAEELLPIVYQELKRLAEARMARLPPGHTLQPTALVHEAYLELIGTEDPGWNSRAHFFGAAARAVQEILVDHARRKGRAKRGGDRARVPLDDDTPESLRQAIPAEELLAINDALDRFREHHPRPAEVVVYRYFAGMDNATIASVLGVSERTVERDWRFARAWLHRELPAPGGDPAANPEERTP
jgi:RNA polymerase sigma factor (TIGR02999 family)